MIPPNIDALIDEWHALSVDDPRSLHDYLGLTWEEFKEWGEGRASEKARRLATGNPTDVR